MAECRLETILEPETVFYNDEGGRSSHLSWFYVVRTNGFPWTAGMAGKAKIEIALCYEDGKEVNLKARKEFLIILNDYDGVNEYGTGRIDFRVDGLISKNVQSRNFLLRMTMSGGELPVMVLETRAFTLKTKRKLVCLSQRAPEVDQRALVLGQAVSYQDYSKQLNPTTPFQNSFFEIFNVERLESQYPAMPVSYPKKRSARKKRGKASRRSKRSAATPAPGPQKRQKLPEPIPERVPEPEPAGKQVPKPGNFSRNVSVMDFEDEENYAEFWGSSNMLAEFGIDSLEDDCNMSGCDSSTLPGDEVDNGSETHMKGLDIIFPGDGGPIPLDFVVPFDFQASYPYN